MGVRIDRAATRPAGLCAGAGHLVIYGNEAFRAVFGACCVGLPAREGLLGLPPEGFSLLDFVLLHGQPAARWVTMNDAEWRLTAAPRRDPGTGEVDGVAFHLRRRDDVLAGGDPRS